MKHNNKYIYPKTVRETIEGKRHYDIDSKEKLPSVEVNCCPVTLAVKSADAVAAPIEDVIV